MLMVFAPRGNVIRQIGPGTIRTMVELGVFEGEFAAFCAEALCPASYVLVDMWSWESMNIPLEGAPQNQHTKEVFVSYLGGDPHGALERAYRKVLERFAGNQTIEIHRIDIAEAADPYPDGHFDLIYLDANHTYEYVLRDMNKWFPKLARGGLFVCNDFYESTDGARQNLGVIPAYNTFARRVETFPIALSSWSFSDFYFSNTPTSDLIRTFQKNLFLSGYNIVELPDELIANYHHCLLEGQGVEHRQVPSLRAVNSRVVKV